MTQTTRGGFAEDAGMIRKAVMDLYTRGYQSAELAYRHVEKAEAALKRIEERWYAQAPN